MTTAGARRSLETSCKRKSGRSWNVVHKDRVWFAFSRYYIAKARLAAAILRCGGTSKKA